MHVLYLHQHFVARSGTSGGRSHEFARILVERGHRVTLVTGAHDQSGLELDGRGLVERTILDGIEILVLNVRYSQKLSMARRILAFVRFMVLSSWVAMRVPGIDVVFATSTPLTIAVPGILASWRRRRPFVFEVRDLWPEIPIQIGVLRNPLVKLAARGLERFAYRCASRVVALSPGMKAGVVAAGVPAERVAVIPNSSDVGLFRVPSELGLEFRAGRPELGDRPLVVYAGAFGRINGLDYVVGLAERVAAIDPRPAFLLVGQGSERSKVLALAAERGVLGVNLFALDPLPRAELPRLLSAATMLSSFCIPLAILEMNSANKFFDAFAAGKPVVINYGGWQADLLEEDGAGIAVDPFDLDRAAAQLVAVLGDQAWLDAAGRASRRLGDEVFDRRRLAARLEEVLATAGGTEDA